jgi:hypothetical protein
VKDLKGRGFDVFHYSTKEFSRRNCRSYGKLRITRHWAEI